jgi:hypothetical protein
MVGSLSLDSQKPTKFSDKGKILLGVVVDSTMKDNALIVSKPPNAVFCKREKGRRRRGSRSFFFSVF